MNPERRYTVLRVRIAHLLFFSTWRGVILCLAVFLCVDFGDVIRLRVMKYRELIRMEGKKKYFIFVPSLLHNMGYPS